MLTVQGGTVTGLKNGTAAVNADNYTTLGSTVTIKADYLAGLAEGDKVMHVLGTDADSDAFDLTATLTITA